MGDETGSHDQVDGSLTESLIRHVSLATPRVVRRGAL